MDERDVIELERVNGFRGYSLSHRFFSSGRLWDEVHRDAAAADRGDHRLLAFRGSEGFEELAKARRCRICRTCPDSRSCPRPLICRTPNLTIDVETKSAISELFRHHQLQVVIAKAYI
jgi:hypothetical protein